jgi:hypothetical protein
LYFLKAQNLKNKCIKYYMKNKTKCNIWDETDFKLHIMLIYYVDTR